MSADWYEITDDGTSIIIAESSGIRSTIDPVDGHHRDDAVIGAIRQQARDIAELRADYVLKCTEYNDTTEFARGLIAERDELRGEIARHERNNTHIGKMFDQLRADLAAAVAERDKLRAIDCGWIAGQPPRYIGEEWFIAKTIHSERVVLRALGDGHSYDYTTADGTYMRAKNIVKWMQFPDSQYKSAAIAEITVRAEQAEARLAAIEAAPTVCEIVAVRERPHIHMIADAPPIGTELIARPAKD